MGSGEEGQQAVDKECKDLHCYLMLLQADSQQSPRYIGQVAFTFLLCMESKVQAGFHDLIEVSLQQSQDKDQDFWASDPVFLPIWECVPWGVVYYHSLTSDMFFWIARKEAGKCHSYGLALRDKVPSLSHFWNINRDKRSVYLQGLHHQS